ncbi:malate dehydrogenase (quinone) [Rhodococcus pyridinivorans]|uniref:malate dehydrogenase (quinone) n=1 Tax=Rhodococcus pyridinivorans TaxID=103816 RepID=UPI001FFF2638|nr:malate dehydrogenase (quinone) [Rhodococcus pyridinivorans]UPK62805.1 malate dehydrogenase (quinone) [Rhodococcus pyridinivorans]
MGALDSSGQHGVHGGSSTAGVLDVALIGGGVMSATLGAMIAKLQPEWSVSLFERLDELAEESSNPWNNAGTGHSGLCELNYMPDPADSSKAADIARQFHLSRQFWASLVKDGDLTEPGAFINSTPHMDIVFGERDVNYLRQRFHTLKGLPLFSAMEYSEDRETIASWSPLLMEGRVDTGPVAATRYEAGTDVDFGALTKALVRTMTASGADVHLQHEVTALKRNADGLWTLKVRDRRNRRTVDVRSRFVFVGAGGYALKLLQKAKIPEVRGYSVFPFGAQFFRTDNPDVVRRHDAKVYSQADLGAPPMSVPHLDKRVVDGDSSLLFGPYATFSTRLLKRGRLIDLFTTIRLNNIQGMLSVGMQNPSLVRYLVLQLVASRKRKFKELQRFYPEAVSADWHLIQAGQRAQLIKPAEDRAGVLMFGTELVTGSDGSIAGLLGASPGASTAPSIMLDLLARCFSDEYRSWQPTLNSLVPALGSPVDTDQIGVDQNLEVTGQILGLTR